MARKGMVIDLKRCIGCNACTIACKAENATPPQVFWARVLEGEVGKYPSARRVFLPVLCNHCKNAPCLEVCPTGATHQREDGVILVDYDKCIGCRACMAACPYEARYFWENGRGYFPEGLTPFEEVGYRKFQRKVVQKCTLCAHRVDNGLEPACVATCPTNCRVFGDLDDPTSPVSRLISERRGFQLRAELGTDPSVYYVQ
ncbi:MAG: 4Fe-4S dicluster domain-containing protein [Chloroflexi bacterium]|nr:4Fe-4S dicluster domain-containing protein [Chloroflexota bacterium]